MNHKLTIAFAAAIIVCSCGGGRHDAFSAGERLAADSTVKSLKDITRLDSLLGVVRKKGDPLLLMAALREKGKMLRNESRFADALKAHGEGLRLAEQYADTAEWVQALNNIGTDYRRMGILDMAQRYHYAAWMMAKEFSDTSFVAKKNRVVSLNGLANVYMTTNNLQRADSALRLALAGETELHSLTGQAINCANIGAVFEQRNSNDSAMEYYHRSMELNRRDSNMLGVALCHTYFGDIMRKRHDYDGALREYDKAYALMRESSDEWHTLNSLVALANIHYLKNNDKKALEFLDRSLRMAEGIGSKEHLADIYRLYYNIYKKRGDYSTALACHEKASALKDSLIDMDKVNRMQNTTLAMERSRQDLRMAEAENQLYEEQTIRHTGYAVFLVIVLLMGSVIALLFHTRRVRTRSHRALQRLNRVRETFFTNITHEFRTPLTVILGLSHDLQQPGSSEEDVRQTGRTIERQGMAMLRLINQLLDISKIRSETGSPDWRNGDVCAYVAMIVETYAAYAEKTGINLSLHTEEKGIDTDFVPDYIHKIVGNLLSNALKFTPRGGSVNISVERDAQLLRIDVADNGRGIPAECLPHIFEEFYQADNSGNDIGTGVGLALVNQIVRNLGGTISVDSTMGEGSTFHVALPLKTGKATRRPTPLTAADDVSDYQDGATDESGNDHDLETATDGGTNDEDSRKRVLVVEDNDDIAEFIGKGLEVRYHVEYAHNGEEGIKKTRDWMPDIIVTDLMMPVIDGLELCRRVRGDELTCHIPIIVVTAKVTEAERIEGIKAGADAYLAKPFSSGELSTRIGKLLEQRELLRARFASAADNDGKGGAKGADDGMKELDRRFLNRLTDCVYLMLNGRKGVDVEAVASRLCMSYGQINRKLTALTGYTPAQYIQRIKIRKAQRMLLAHPELDFNSIAEQCGFSDYSNFVRAFRKVAGLTPTQFIRKE